MRFLSPTHDAPELEMLPSEYFHRNFMVTFEDDAIWPNSVSILDDIMQDVPEEDVKKMVWGNVQNLYNIDVTALPV